jgi:hypothetical protein
MNKETVDQGWQQLQAHVEGFFGQVLRGDVKRIAYKPLFIPQLLEMPSEHHQNERQGVMAINAKKGGGVT